MSKLELIEDTDARTLEIVITGDFDFSLYETFLASWKHSSKPCRYVINLTHCSSLQSSALGMLLLMQEEIGDKSIQIISGNSKVDAVLDLVHFDRLFEIEKAEEPATKRSE